MIAKILYEGTLKSLGMQIKKFKFTTASAFRCQVLHLSEYITCFDRVKSFQIPAEEEFN